MGNPTVTPIAEAWHNGGFIVSEQKGHLSREAVTLASGAVCLPGLVLARKLAGATGAAAAFGTNTGNATFGAITVAAPAVAGVYNVLFVAATSFVVSAPSGVEIGHGVTGTAFSAGGLGFTITAGTNAMVAGEGFSVTVSGGTVSYLAFDPTATDGSQNAVAVLYGYVDATAATKRATVIARLAEVNASELVWGANVTTDAHKATGTAGLALSTIIAR